MEMEDYGAVLADTLGGGKPSNSPRVKYGTVTKVSGSTIDVSLAGGTITGVCMTVACAGAKVGDRVVLLVDGALVTCLGIVATADNARYVKKSDAGNLSVSHAATADTATSASAVAWGNVTGKPSTYAPSSHKHDVSDVTGSVSTWSSNGLSAAKFGRVVCFSMVTQLNLSTSDFVMRTVCTLPSGWRPKQEIVFAGHQNFSTSPIQIHVMPSGEVKAQPVGNRAGNDWTSGGGAFVTA